MWPINVYFYGVPPSVLVYFGENSPATAHACWPSFCRLGDSRSVIGYLRMTSPHYAPVSLSPRRWRVHTHISLLPFEGGHVKMLPNVLQPAVHIFAMAAHTWACHIGSGSSCLGRQISALFACHSQQRPLPVLRVWPQGVQADSGRPLFTCNLISTTPLPSLRAWPRDIGRFCLSSCSDLGC